MNKSSKVENTLQRIYKKYYEGKTRTMVYKLDNKTLRPILKSDKNLSVVKEFKKLAKSQPKKYDNMMWIGYVDVVVSKSSFLLNIGLSPYKKGLKQASHTIVQRITFHAEEILEFGVLTHTKIFEISKKIKKLGYNKFKSMGPMTYTDFMKL